MLEKIFLSTLGVATARGNRLNMNHKVYVAANGQEFREFCDAICLAYPYSYQTVKRKKRTGGGLAPMDVGFWNDFAFSMPPEFNILLSSK